MIFEIADKPYWITTQPQTDEAVIYSTDPVLKLVQLLYCKKDNSSQVHTTNVVCSKNRSTWSSSI